MALNKAPKPIFVCAECGATTSRWVGRCPDCGAWNTMEETVQSPEPARGGNAATPAPRSPAVRLSDLETPSYIRSGTGMGELDRVLGGGLVEGSVVLISGEPGIGKSTILLQISAHLSASRRVLYVTGEESGGQIRLRYNRLGIKGDEIFLLTETNTDAILGECRRISPDVIVIDSVQTLYSERFSSAPGSVTQVREGALAFITYAKTEGAAVFLVGHVNKEGGISGPKMLEHMVDAVLYFEGERTQAYRIIRATKNRYGSTNEIGVFEMSDRGLVEIPNPSEVLISERPKSVSGSCAGCILEGSRPLITEIQTLVTGTVYAVPKRTSDGFDYNRLGLLLAVLERRLGLRFSQNDVYLNIAGGLRLDEPAADLAVSMALISGITDRALPDDLIAFGEVGLSGEVRAVPRAEYRVKEAVRLGFTTIVVPKRQKKKDLAVPDGVKVVGVSSLYEVLPFLIKKKDGDDAT